jgi:hypothetical protein
MPCIPFKANRVSEEYIASVFMAESKSSKKPAINQVVSTVCHLQCMEVTYFSETSIDFQRTTRRYTPEGRTHKNADITHHQKLFTLKLSMWLI